MGNVPVLPQTSLETAPAGGEARPRSTLSGLALALLSKRPEAQSPPPSEAATLVAHTLVAPADTDVLAALRAFAQGDAADDPEPTLLEAIAAGELLVAMRAKPQTSAHTSRDLSLVLVKTTTGERILPLFSNADFLRQFARDELTVGTPLSVVRAIEVAMGMDFDAIEIDRGSMGACSLPRALIDRLQRALALWERL